MAEFGNGLAEESLIDSDPGHPELEDPGVGDEEPGLEEGEAAIEDPVSEGLCCRCEVQNSSHSRWCPMPLLLIKCAVDSVSFLSLQIVSHMPCVTVLWPGRY